MAHLSPRGASGSGRVEHVPSTEHFDPHDAAADEYCKHLQYSLVPFFPRDLQVFSELMQKWSRLRNGCRGRSADGGYRTIAERLNAKGVPTKRGGEPSSVRLFGGFSSGGLWS